MDDQNQAKKPGPELRRLNAFAGKWNTSGTLQAMPGDPPVYFHGTDTYEWLPGGFFLLHTVDVMMGNERKQSIEVIGYDPLSELYPMQHFDDQGESGIMHGRLEGDQWTILSSELRFNGIFSADMKTLTGVWEQCMEDSWTHLMEIALTKP
ncbi:DUF1579 family protein [Dyadobacter arcticus]|uniref:DUF1579 domain-containing protein n=1 Tax=Dyadobacter arcticus TaxID=1078754 RepID=A0ABX0UQD9_9BACT|nr:DUF1579 family protein [Dyadobacter arcticus]NIJ53895.1 hypothetical protein [Dyadobacter arcticus]